MGKARSKKYPPRVFRGNQHVKVSKESPNKTVIEEQQPRPSSSSPSGANQNPGIEDGSNADENSSLQSIPTNTSFQNSLPSASTPILRGKSASFRKLFEGSTAKKTRMIDDDAKESGEGFRLVDLQILAEIFAMLCCPECHSSPLYLKDDLAKKNGCASSIKLSCNECRWYKEFFTSRRIGGAFDVNQRLVYGMRCIGQGFSGANKFCTMMNLPSLPTKKNYSKLSKSLNTAVYDVAKESMADAGRETKSLLGSDCGVSVDGSWQKRGYVSLNGCVTAISIDTGKILDIEPMSRYCKGCQANDKLDKQSEKYKIWKANHVKCNANFKGSAPAMEAEGAERIFKRSVENHGLYYTDFYGDGDSKSHPRVAKVYEEVGKSVKKLECIGHVQKRMGAALRKLRKEKKKVGGKGKLTDKMIDRMQNYYGIAIRSNIGNLENMKKAILATLFHCASSKGNEYHTYCPDGEESWCLYKSDKVKGTQKFKPGPGLPLTVIADVKPIFARLSQDTLLMKCLHGKTQNQNESFNKMIWDRVPKATYVGRDLFELGVYDAVGSFNMGASSSLEILKKVKIDPGKYTTAGCEKIDISRVYNSEYKAKETSKLARKKLRSKRRGHNDKLTEKEGPTYSAGNF